MNLQNSNWKFDESVVPIFDEHVKKSVPMYDEIHNLITDIAGWYIKDGVNVYDIGTSTGKVLKNLIDNYSVKANYIGIDSSDNMINKLKEDNLDIDLVYGDVTTAVEFENAGLITSVLTLQFIQEDKRQKLINDIYNGLNKGSAFILVEKVIGENARFNEIYTELYHELKLKNGLSPQHVFDKSKSIRGVMKPLTISENIAMLDNAGFKDVDIFFKWNNFAGIIAVK